MLIQINENLVPVQTVQLQAPISSSQAGGQGSLTLKVRGDDGSLSPVYTLMDELVYILILTNSIQSDTKLPHFLLHYSFMQLDYSAKFSGGQILSVWAEVPSYILSDPSKRQNLILNYKRGGLLPGTQPDTLALDAVNLLVVDSELALTT
jgi:hypothetical protein